MSSTALALAPSFCLLDRGVRVYLGLKLSQLCLAKQPFCLQICTILVTYPVDLVCPFGPKLST